MSEEDGMTDAIDAIRDGVLHAWDKHGWTQYTLGNDEDGYCAMGAWYKATGLEYRSLTSLDPLTGLANLDPLTIIFRQCFMAAACELADAPPAATVEAFNDDPRRSEEDIRLVTKHAFELMHEVMPLVGSASKIMPHA